MASSRDLNVALYAAPLPAPLLCFSAIDMPQRVEALRSEGLVFARQVPHALGSSAVGMLRAPDGVHIVLSTAVDAA